MTTEFRRLHTSRNRCALWGTQLCMVALAAALLGAGCASQPATPAPTTTPPAWLEAAAMAPRPATPASRDALAEGLRWILEDAPQTRIQSSTPSDPPAPEDLVDSGDTP